MNRIIPITCECCKHNEMVETSYSDIINSYFLECPKCKHEQHLHFTSYDSILVNYDEVEENQPIKFSWPVINKMSESEKFAQKIDKGYEQLKAKWSKMGL